MLTEVHEDGSTAELRPLLASGRDNYKVLESFIRKAVGAGLHRPVVSALVIGSGALAGLQLARQGRVVAALAVSLSMSAVTALAAWLLTRRMLGDDT